MSCRHAARYSQMMVGRKGLGSSDRELHLGGARSPYRASDSRRGCAPEIALFYARCDVGINREIVVSRSLNLDEIGWSASATASRISLCGAGSLPDNAFTTSLAYTGAPSGSWVPLPYRRHKPRPRHDALLPLTTLSKN